MNKLNKWIFIKHLSCDILSFICLFSYLFGGDMTNLGAVERGGNYPMSFLCYSQSCPLDLEERNFSALLIESWLLLFSLSLL